MAAGAGIASGIGEERGTRAFHQLKVDGELPGMNRFLLADGEPVTASQIAEDYGGNDGQDAEDDEGLMNSMDEDGGS